ncbi:pentapeptide repeat-containing protein [Streptomyces agglomeratus]|uniref:pentapeptide repeat-containing protein n=1 Tax=Streptomyces agglomeratus TaxID=285458 RepID=UPI00099F8502|nr:pentapeptide repeat-containing protein [Streptomyces agglomeratus]
MPGWLVVFLAVCGAVIILLALWGLVFPRRLAPRLRHEELTDLREVEGLSKKDPFELADARLRLQNDLRTTALQAVGGLAVLAGAVLAFEQLREDGDQAADAQTLTRQGQASERFTRAIDQLGSSRPETRTGGVYGLEQVASQHREDNRLAVTEVLVAFLHRRAAHSDWNRDCGLPARLGTRAPDLQAAITVIGRQESERADPLLDLSRLDLSRADLREAKLQNTNFFITDLHRADLTGADVSRVNDSREEAANFSRVNLCKAKLVGTNLSGANLSTAYLHGAQADKETIWPRGFDWRDAGVLCKNCS